MEKVEKLKEKIYNELELLAIETEEEIVESNGFLTDAGSDALMCIGAVQDYILNKWNGNFNNLYEELDSNWYQQFYIMPYIYEIIDKYYHNRG